MKRKKKGGGLTLIVMKGLRSCSTETAGESRFLLRDCEEGSLSFLGAGGVCGVEER